MWRRTCSGWRTTLTPSIRASPLSGRIRVASIRRVVVLPAPLGPSKPKISPWQALKLRLSTATRIFSFVLSSFCCLDER